MTDEAVSLAGVRNTGKVSPGDGGCGGRVSPTNDRLIPVTAATTAAAATAAPGAGLTDRSP